MEPNYDRKITQWQNALKNQGFCKASFKLPNEIFRLVKDKNFEKIDESFKKLLSPSGELFQFVIKFTPFPISHIEHIISLREAKNEWEEDGIWHDDGSRVLAFSLSLTIDPPGGGILEIRKKGDDQSTKLETPAFGDLIIFKTGQDNYEHKINKVTAGSRLIIAGWLYNI